MYGKSSDIKREDTCNSGIAQEFSATKNVIAAVKKRVSIRYLIESRNYALPERKNKFRFLKITEFVDFA
jgi:hypothetical protein